MFSTRGADKSVGIATRGSYVHNNNTIYIYIYIYCVVEKLTVTATICVFIIQIRNVRLAGDCYTHRLRTVTI